MISLHQKKHHAGQQSLSAATWADPQDRPTAPAPEELEVTMTQCWQKMSRAWLFGATLWSGELWPPGRAGVALPWLPIKGDLNGLSM